LIIETADTLPQCQKQPMILSDSDREQPAKSTMHHLSYTWQTRRCRPLFAKHWNRCATERSRLVRSIDVPDSERQLSIARKLVVFYW